MSAGPTAAPGRFVQCLHCRKTLFAKDFLAAQKVCSYCGHHHRLTWQERVDWTFDPGSFEETDVNLVSVDPLSFPEYREKLSASEAKTGLRDSVVSGTATLEGHRLSVAIADFAFMGGSMGSVAGEKITRTLELGLERRMPSVIFCASGGARMQEGLWSLMQMGKTVGAVERCRESGVPFIAVFTDPTMAGVLASYASVADVILAEPRALVGFAGSRVSKQAQVIKAPDDFQTAEFAHRSGMVDRIVPRRELRSTLATLVRALGAALPVSEKVVA
ncbi:MAG: acetyl-CoA carboxylase carboxyl transferase subunit beta [Fimbriimonadaceae bacterium]|nr:acetyl-CoA carboxylase carboxyl transferase subunit beta [Fimbriimonadaceae bacterium]QYK54755.1 MAG: acetyl-CoA carboxylase carboxyl transferase subunit beta [Fimbriimonadaceae bacterium]